MTHPPKFSAAVLAPQSTPLGMQLRSPEQGKRSLPAWLLSLLLHLSVIAGLIFFLTQIPNGSGEAKNRTGGIVLVDIPYVVGGVCFTLGAYCGVLEAVNVGNPDEKLTWFMAAAPENSRTF